MSSLPPSPPVSAENLENTDLPLSGFLIPVPTHVIPLSQIISSLAHGLFHVPPRTSFHGGEFSLPNQLFLLVGSLRQSWAGSSAVGGMGPTAAGRRCPGRPAALAWHREKLSCQKGKSFPCFHRETPGMGGKPFQLFVPFFAPGGHISG